MTNFHNNYDNYCPVSHKEYRRGIFYFTKKRVQQKNLRKTVTHQLSRYCENTTLHGLRYVGDSHLTFGERIFWFISFSFAIAFAGYYISNIYEKWKSSPVIISFSPFDAELASIPFPGITICNMNQAKKTEADKIIENGSIFEKKLLNDVCNGNATFNDTDQEISWKSLRDFLVRVGNSCTDLLKNCKWGTREMNCDDIFNNDLTDEGLCCSFNRLPPDKIFRNLKDISILNQTYPSNVYDWHAEKGFKEVVADNSIPRRPLGAGAHLGLSIVLDAQVENYYCSSTRSVGFKVILSNPIETPKMADFGFLISPGFETRVTIVPSVREATASLRDVPIEKRQCYFSNERPLLYYRTYSQKNCINECQSNATLTQCKCVPYYLPTKNETVYCSKIDDDCIIGVKMDVDGDCQCLPPCFHVSYENVLSSTPILPSSEKIVNFLIFLANVGGILGLWLGLSSLSLIEILYFTFLKSVCTYARKKRQSYTQRNCILECQSNHTLKLCNCVPYYLPRDVDIENCGKSDKDCMELAKADMETLQGNGSSCHCLPSCFSIQYSQARSFAQLSKQAVNQDPTITISPDYATTNMAIVHFFFHNSKFTKEIKSQLYGFTEILSNIGGLLSLCLGFSFLSFVEILYFLSLRIMCEIRKPKKPQPIKNEPHLIQYLR
ncbi:hypothetical protein ABEB36_011898 [Hypothenemus hampei]|uniref:Uncharacterized protein n=1 Tax=Hypothenemus hampei TaxID=57062 RepID=A0ABD1E9J0_HYPHA